MRSLISVFLSALVVLGAAACSHDHPLPKVASDYDKTPVGVAEPTGATVSLSSDQVMNVGPDLRKACGIDDVNRAPRFDFDSSSLSSNDRDVLGQVARCLTTGPMKGRSVSLVGRADPRGESEYNMSLGEERSTSGKTYLQQLGVDPARLHDTSRGALDAKGHDEETWRLDRRVDIELAE